jgi:hypothetical protein
VLEWPLTDCHREVPAAGLLMIDSFPFDMLEASHLEMKGMWRGGIDGEEGLTRRGSLERRGTEMKELQRFDVAAYTMHRLLRGGFWR